MTSLQIKQKILKRLDDLSEADLAKVLEFAESMSLTIRGTPGKELIRFFGTIDSEDCRRMATAIEEGCGRVDSR